MKRDNRLSETQTGKRLIVTLAAALLTTEPVPEPAPEPSPTPAPEPEPSPEPTPAPDDLSTLFTAEEVEARKAETARRAALTDEERAAEDQAKADEAAKNQVPEEYAAFTAPDGVVLDEDLLSEFRPLAKEMGLSQDKAQKLIDLSAKQMQKIMDGVFAAHEQRKASWLEEAKADKEIGEDVKLWNADDPESAKNSVALRAFNTVSAGSPGLKAMVDELGIGNHPEFIRVFYRLGQNMREDTFEVPGSGGTVNTKGNVAKSLWPDMN